MRLICPRAAGTGLAHHRGDANPGQPTVTVWKEQPPIVAAGADARRQRKALIITASEPLRDALRGRPWRQQLRACAGLVAAPTDPVEHRATVQALALTAQRALAARADAEQLEGELRQLVTAIPRLQEWFRR